MTAAAERALTRYREETLQYGQRTGLLELRRWIAKYAADDNIDISPDHVLVTNGAKQAIELVCRLLLEEGDSIVVTAPTYFTAIPIFRSFGVTFIEVGQDDEGLDVRALEELLEGLRREGRPRPKFIYTVPDYHNPTGINMSLERRRALVDLAIKEQIVVIEDSPYRRIIFDGQAFPPLKSFDPGNLVIQVGTFSKLMAPGLRVGWAATSPDLIARMYQLKSDGGTCPLTQRIIVDFCATGQLRRHTERVRDTYRIHRDQMVAGLRRELPDVSMRVPTGGYYIWLTLPSDVDGDELTTRAREAGVSVLPGSKCFARSDARHPKNHIRVAFSHATVDEIDEGVRRLAAAFRSITTRPAVEAIR